MPRNIKLGRKIMIGEVGISKLASMVFSPQASERLL